MLIGKVLFALLFPRQARALRRADLYRRALLGIASKPAGLEPAQVALAALDTADMLP